MSICAQVGRSIMQGIAEKVVFPSELLPSDDLDLIMKLSYSWFKCISKIHESGFILANSSRTGGDVCPKQHHCSGASTTGQLTLPKPTG